MVRSLVASVLIVGLVGSAAAQSPDPSPYPPPPPEPQPYPQPYPQPQPQPYVPPPQQYIPVVLTADEQKLLAQGEISDGQHVGGTVANLLLSFGIGQAIQGRWGDTGWIFTLGGVASMTAMFAGIGQAIGDGLGDGDGDGGATLLAVGAIGFTVFYAWGVVDAISGPPAHNRRVRELKMRLGMPVPMYGKVLPYVNTTRDGGGVAGVTFRF